MQASQDIRFMYQKLLETRMRCNVSQQSTTRGTMHRPRLLAVRTTYIHKENDMKGDIYEFDNQVFPLALWVSVQPDIPTIKSRFKLVEGDDYDTLRELRDEDVHGNWAAYRMTVAAKDNATYGCLCVLNYPSEYNGALIAHEASHAYDDFAGILGLPQTGETRAYVTEWIFSRIERVWSQHNNKGEWQISK